MSSRWLLLRGLTRGNGHWGEFPEILKKTGSEVELLEIPGNGTRCKERTPFNVDEVIEKIKSQSMMMRSPAPVNILGISLGGMIALKWAEREPKRFSRIVAVNSSLRKYSSVFSRIRPQIFLKILRATLIRSDIDREKLILSITSNNKQAQARNLEEFADFSRLHRVTIGNFLRQLMLANKIEVRHVPQIPVQIIVSVKDRLVHHNCSFELAKILGVQPIVHATAGHDLPLDDPSWLARILVDN